MEISSDSDDSEFISSEENCDGGDNQQQWVTYEFLAGTNSLYV